MMVLWWWYDGVMMVLWWCFVCVWM
jgi:hypothetical protein